MLGRSDDALVRRINGVVKRAEERYGPGHFSEIRRFGELCIMRGANDVHRIRRDRLELPMAAKRRALEPSRGSVSV